MHELLDGAVGQRMALSAYQADFEKIFWAIKEGGFWKLERAQTFKEPDNASWQAFASGQWDEAKRLNEARRPDLISYYHRITKAGFVTRRVRIVEKPITPYLQWELHLLRIRHEYGGLARVVGSEQVRELEQREPLPEIYTLGAEVMYQAIYDDDGILEGAVRYNDRELVQRCRTAIQSLYDLGEDLLGFFEREVAVLGPPATVG
jgi:hypothetical protein